MNRTIQHIVRLFVLSTLFTLLALATVPTLAADPPKITVIPAWRPGATLDSIDLGTLNSFDGGDDFRYVDVEIYVTTSVQFWAVQLTCTVTPTALTSYNSAATDGDPANTIEPVVWGPRWGGLGFDFTEVVEAYNTATGARTFTATRLGNIYPMGTNGYDDTWLLATLRYRAKDLTTNSTSSLSCTSTFLNRNGASVLTPTYTAPVPLNIITGYSISGVITYQSRASHAGITVECDGPDGDSLPDFSILTTTTGAFTNSALRNQGFFNCAFYSNITNPTVGYQPDKYLAGQTWFELRNQSYTLLPIMLHGGNLSQNDVSTDGNPTTVDERIDGLDIAIITAPANWSKPVTAGDINGDNKTDRADLAIAAGNFDSWEAYYSPHAIYSLPRDYDFWQNSRIWLGVPWSGPVTQFVPTPPPNNRDHWPMLSPDGKKIVFTRDNPDGEIALWMSTITNGVAAAPTRLTPSGAWYSAWAPSWSPDGTRIAFICSWWDNGTPDTDDYSVHPYASGYLADMGVPCVIDVNGKNFQTLNPSSGTALARIYPPAWLSNTEVVYGGTWTIPSLDDANTNCPNTLCYYNLQTAESREFDPDIMTGGLGSLQIADMPVIRGDVLFYRFYDDNGIAPDTRVIRYAQIVGGGVDPFEVRPGSAPFHMQADYDADPGVPTDYQPVSTDVDYFNVARNGWELIYYTSGGFDFTKAWWNTGDLAGPTSLEWWEPFTNWVDDMVGNPPPLNTPYDPTDEADASALYAHRNTVDWVP